MSWPSGTGGAVSRRDLLRLWLPIVGLVVVGFVIAYLNLEPPPPHHLAMAAGRPGGAYYAVAQRYAAELAHQGFELEVVATAGSMENLQLLRSGRVQVGLVQGGTAGPEDAAELEALASLFLEPVWLYHRQEVAFDGLDELAGRRLGVGAEGSGTREMALLLLADNDIGEGQADLRSLPADEAVAALDAGELDAAFFVASPEAAYVRSLAVTPGVALYSFRRHRAYRHAHPFLERVVLGEGMLDLPADQPPEDVSLLATAASLGARQDLHPDLIPLLLEMARAVHGHDGIFADAGSFPSPRYVALPLNDKARRYLVNGPSFLHRVLPFRWAAEIDRLKILLLPLVTLLIPLFKMAPPLYRWRIRSRIFRWYEDLRQADEMLLRPEAPGDELAQRIEQLERLQREVTQEVRVPLSYMDEFYRLRRHISLVLEALQQRRQGEPQP